MKKYLYLLPWFSLLLTGVAFAGNPDRQGEAGAYELLINPWARTAGIQNTNTAGVSGVDALFLNVAGLSRINTTQIALGHTRYLVGADININALGIGQRIGKGGVLGIQLMSMDFGDIPLTTIETPDGSGATFSPSFFNLGISYAQRFENKVSVGFTVKAVNESISSVSARGVALDAGVQYVTGEKDRFKFGISLRNVGGKMRFQGEGLNIPRPNPDGTFNYNLSFYNKSAGFEMPSQLNIGASYDWPIARDNRLTLMGNFTSNAFSRDNVGAGLEFAAGQNIAFRAGYKYEFVQSNSAIKESVDNGLALGITLGIPVKKGSDTRVNVDYSYRQSKVWSGTHNIAARIDL